MQLDISISKYSLANQIAAFLLDYRYMVYAPSKLCYDMLKFLNQARKGSQNICVESCYFYGLKIRVCMLQLTRNLYLLFIAIFPTMKLSTR